MRSALFHIDTALLTSRCVIRRFREGDGSPLYELLQRNHTHLIDQFPSILSEADSPEGAEAYVRRKLAGWLLQEEFAMGIWDAEAKLLGCIHIFNIDWHTPKGEVSYFIDHQHSGQGIMTEVLSRIVQFSFQDLHMEKLNLHTLIDNYNSQRLARRVGFSREGDLRNEFRRQSGTLVDLMRFGLTREVYGG